MDRWPNRLARRLSRRVTLSVYAAGLFSPRVS